MSTLAGSTWRLKVDIGLEPGSYLAQSDWGASGARLRFNLEVNFEDTPATVAEELVGPLKGTRTLVVQSDGSFVGFEGEKVVTFSGGGWCVQRQIGVPATAEGLLRFWLDCSSGASKGDLTVEAGERIFFSTGVWDDTEELQRMVRDRDELEAKLKAGTGVGEEGRAAGALDNIPGLAQLAAFRRSAAAYDERVALQARREFYARIPSLGAGPAAIALGRGGLSVKRSVGSLLGTSDSYHILGSFAAEPVVSGLQK